MTKYHVFSLVSFVQRQFERWGLISNTPLSPNGHGKKPSSSRPGTWYSHYRQRFMTKIHVLGLVLFVRRHLKRCGWVYHTTLGPSDHGSKPPSSRLRTWYSRHRQWFMTKTHVFRLVILVRRQFKRCVLISTTLDPSDHGSKPPSSRLGTLYSHWGQWFMTDINVHSIVFFHPTPIQVLWVALQHYTRPQWPWCEAIIVEAGDLVQLL